MKRKQKKGLQLVVSLIIIYIVVTIISVKAFTVIEHKNLTLLEIENIKNNKYILTFIGPKEKIVLKYRTDFIDNLELNEIYNVSTNGINKNTAKYIERKKSLWQK